MAGERAHETPTAKKHDETNHRPRGRAGRARAAATHRFFRPSGLRGLRRRGLQPQQPVEDLPGYRHQPIRPQRLKHPHLHLLIGGPERNDLRRGINPPDHSDRLAVSARHPNLRSCLEAHQQHAQEIALLLRRSSDDRHRQQQTAPDPQRAQAPEAELRQRRSATESLRKRAAGRPEDTCVGARLWLRRHMRRRGLSAL